MKPHDSKRSLAFWVALIGGAFFSVALMVGPAFGTGDDDDDDEEDRGRRVRICHIPPGNPANFQTIWVNRSALPAHLGHGDFRGRCEEHLDQLCDDRNRCTVDHHGGLCIPEEIRPDVECNDGFSCTFDGCDPTAGCVSYPADNLCENTPVNSISCPHRMTLSCCDEPDDCSGDPQTDCFYLPINSVDCCDDGDACTIDENPAGECGDFGTTVCDDGNSLTTDCCTGVDGGCGLISGGNCIPR